FAFHSTHAAYPQLYTLSLHDALPILIRHLASLQIHPADIGPLITVSGEGQLIFVRRAKILALKCALKGQSRAVEGEFFVGEFRRSEEHTSELQSQSNLVCRLLLEKKK